MYSYTYIVLQLDETHTIHLSKIVWISSSYHKNLSKEFRKGSQGSGFATKTVGRRYPDYDNYLLGPAPSRDPFMQVSVQKGSPSWRKTDMFRLVPNQMSHVKTYARKG